MAKIIWLSDLHFVAQGHVQGHDPRVRLARAIGHVNTHHRDAAACVISGDLVDRGTPGDYAALHEQLTALKVPYLPMVGNHDDRALVRQVFDVPRGVEGFIQYVVPTDDALLVCLDTHTPGADHGSFCADRLDWLTDQLAEADKPALIFMHHPPMALGLPMQDTDRLRDSAALLDLLQSHSRKVLQLCIGHVHRPITGTLRGLSYATMRSVLYQAPPPVPAWDWDSFEPAKENPGLGVLTLSDGVLRMQYEEFCRYEDGVT